MKEADYKSIVHFVNKSNGSDHDCLKELRRIHPTIMPQTLGSIINLCGRHRTKVNLWKCQNNAQKIYSQFMELVKSSFPTGFVGKSAKTYNVQPIAVAKILLDQNAKHHKNSVPVQVLIKDSTLIDNPFLAYETFLCSLWDHAYSSLGALIKTRMGLEYESKLQQMLTKHGLSYKTEMDLRKQAYPKTPDILLDVPIGVNNSVVRWIESKALFADEQCHNQYCQDQYWSYYESFGPGLVIYWFGFLEGIITPNENRYIALDRFPEEFVEI